MKFLLSLFLTFAFSVSAFSQINLPGCSGSKLTKTVTVASGDTTSAAINLGCFTLVGVQMGTITGTALSFTGAVSSDATYAAVKSTVSGTALSYTVASNTFAAVDPKDLYGLTFLKVVMGTAQASNRTLTLYLKGF